MLWGLFCYGNHNPPFHRPDKEISISCLSVYQMMSKKALLRWFFLAKSLLDSFTSNQTALASSTGISTIPIPVGWTVSYGCIIILCCRSWQNDFSNGRSQIIAWIAISRLGKSRRTTSDGSLQAQTYLTALFTCQRTVRLLSACINSFLQMDWYRMIRKSGIGKRGVY